MVNKYKVLTREQAEFFLENGYVVIKQAFSKDNAEEWSRNLWVRLGIDPNDKSTWTKERIHMPWHKRVSVANIAPKAWAAMNDLLGEGRIKEEDSTWGDSFIINLGTPELDPDKSTPPQEFDNWHVDGDFFVHYLDSPEQALLVIPLFSDIKPRGGGTFIAPEGIDHVARYLAAHPEGVLPAQGKFVSSEHADDPAADPAPYVHMDIVKKCTKFAEMTGEVGDVVLMHPLMLHSASKNHLRDVRVIINPPVALKEPFRFDRADPNDFSLVELKTLRALGTEKLDFRPTTERRRIPPKSMAVKDAMLKEERKRLAEFERVHGPTRVSIVPTILAPA